MKPRQKEPAVFHDRAVSGYDLDLCESCLFGLRCNSDHRAEWVRERKAALQRRVETLSRKAQQETTPTQ